MLAGPLVRGGLAFQGVLVGSIRWASTSRTTSGLTYRSSVERTHAPFPALAAGLSPSTALFSDVRRLSGPSEWGLPQQHDELVVLAELLHAGAAVGGDVGSTTRLGYPVVGDTINLGARVEALTREHQAEILITQLTSETVKFHVESEPLGLVPVRGRQDLVAVYRVRGLKAPGAL